MHSLRLSPRMGRLDEGIHLIVWDPNPGAVREDGEVAPPAERQAWQERFRRNLRETDNNNTQS